MIRIVTTIFLFCISIWCFSQQDTTNLNNWKYYPIPTDSGTLANYNWSDKEYIVSLKNNEVHAITKDEMQFENELPFKIEPLDKTEALKMRGRRSVLKVDDGYLVGFWRGEWGGCLFWFGNDGKQRYQISNHWVLQFLERNKKYYAIEGLAHLSMSEGSIVEIEKSGGKWITTEYLKLPFAPYAATTDSAKNFIIITSENLLLVDINKSIDILINKGFWGSLYSTSIIVKNDIVFVGMRQGVFRFNLSTHKQEWLMRE